MERNGLIELEAPKMNSFGTWLVHGVGGACGNAEGVSMICHTREGVQYWMNEIIARGGVPSLTRWAKGDC